MKGAKWYAYIYPKALEVMALPKIFTPDIALRASFSVDVAGEHFFTGGVAGGYGILPKAHTNREYLLGLLNSTLLDWCNRQTATQMRGGYYSFESRYIRHLPICTIDSTNPQDVARHDRMVALVTQMLDLHARLAAEGVPHEKALLQKRIEQTDRQIDRLVYELYGLTEAEIAVVEESAQK